MEWRTARAEHETMDLVAFGVPQRPELRLVSVLAVSLFICFAETITFGKVRSHRHLDLCHLTVLALSSTSVCCYYLISCQTSVNLS
jgi:hypothetical protein